MPFTIRATLCEIRDDLHALRRTVAARGQIEAIQAIDALIGVAEAEAIRAIRRIDLGARPATETNRKNNGDEHLRDDAARMHFPVEVGQAWTPGLRQG